MSALELLFSTTRSPFSAAIRAATWSRWSHVALVDGAAVIEAHALHGVRAIPLADACGAARDYCVSAIPCEVPEAVIWAARSQLGKGYDWSAVLGYGLRRDWQEDDAWFCSELIAWAFEKTGQGLFRPESLRRVTPEHLWMLAPARELDLRRSLINLGVTNG